MKNPSQKSAQPALLKSLALLLIASAALVTGGCDERGPDDGVEFNTILLPTDLVLNLACENVGIADETCVLNDPENPYVTVTILEFDVNNPGAENKFDLFNAIPAGPSGAKARFYFWATALARRQSGENQWYLARALHELYTYNNDEIIRLQALKAYRSVLENFFGSVTFFEAFGSSFPAPLNELVGCNIFNPASTSWAPLVLNANGSAAPPLGILELFGEWGFTYQPSSDPNDPTCPGAVMSVIIF
ncbi:MAG: hypothetical protein WBM54_11105 [Woeseia sp.]